MEELLLKIKKLENALQQEKSARKKAESKLEKKTNQLLELSEALKISNQKLSKHLQEKTTQLEGVFANILDAYIVIDNNGYAIKINDAAVNLFGLKDRDEELKVIDFVRPEYIEYTKSAFKELYKKGKFFNYRAKILTKNNEEKIVQVNASLVYNDNGEPIAAQGIARDITNETLLKKQIEEKKRQLDIVMDNSPIGISLSKSNFNGLILANKTLSKMLGYTEEELNAIDPKKITHPEDRQWSMKHLKNLRDGKINNYSVEKRYIKKNGTIIWVKTSAKAVVEDNGKSIYQVATIEDISKEKEAVEKLKESENRLAALILNLQTGILLEDENRKIVLVNERFCNMFNIKKTPKSLNGLDCISATQKNKKFFKNPEGFINRINELLQNKKIALNDVLHLVDGRVIERNFIPIYHKKIYKGHLWSYTDITIQKKYRESIQAQKEKYSNIIANMNLGLLENDIHDNIVLSNQSFSEMSGYTQEELLGKKAADLFLTKKSKKIFDLTIKNKDPKSIETYELAVKNKSGNIRHWLVSTTQNFDVEGNKIGSIGIHLDITKIKELEKQKEQLLSNLEKQNEHLNEYAHIVSHDLKSPLRNISALLSWTKEDFKDKLGEDSLTNLDLMQSKVEKMDHLIENILKYSSIENDILSKEPVNLNEIVTNIAELIYIPEHISIKICKKLPTIKIDKTRIQQVFQNLISNAVNYIDKEKGIIEIDFLEDNNQYTFSVKDNGVGIAKEHHEKIFKIFNSLGNHEKSTGIGLSIVKKVVNLYKGEIWLKSELQKGTTFFFTIAK
ncbi:PAS/PAC sensor signal transduction histidine kinase [Mesonia phycicola]|uniref:histidine kinase n=1 Tax=Mesonia phycicola TaxID=579105 RepID=A0A1M6DIA2_9FLAO|nr:PAS domain S-box protein [Mesonia phycicola]SHI72861.1 PAS/PAC sensor signal transduction histidine kinase [Mesonia phycicola]